jgi:hypothetical protein
VVIMKRDWFLSRIEASEKRKKKEYKEL